MSVDRISGLRQIDGWFDAVLCDVWGVLHNGVRSFPAASAALAWVRGEGKPVVLVTNAPRPAPEVEKQLAGLGVTAASYDAIVTSGDVTRNAIRERGARRVLHVGPDRDLGFYEGVDVSLVENPDEADLVSVTGLVDDRVETPEDYREPLERLRDRGLPMVCANPDIVVQRGSDLVYCGGALAALYEELGGVVVMSGKPFPPIYDAAVARMNGVARSRILAIGDGLETDIRGANRAGLPALLITGGIHAAELSDQAAIEATLRKADLEAVAHMPFLSDGPAP